MGVSASVYAVVAPLAIPSLLILLAYLLVRRVERNGGSFEIDWKTVAFAIKFSSTPGGLHKQAEPQDQPVQPEATAATDDRQLADGTARPLEGGGGP